MLSRETYNKSNNKPITLKCNTDPLLIFMAWQQYASVVIHIILLKAVVTPLINVK